MNEVVRAFGLEELRGGVTGVAEAARGAMGRIFRVETSTGTWAVKELFPHDHADDAEPFEPEHDETAELERQAAFVEAASKAGVAAPRFIRSVDGEIVATVDGVRWRAFEWVDLAGPPSLARAGETLARLHAIEWPTTEPVDPWYTRRTLGGPWEQLLERAKDQPWAPVLRAQIPELAALDAIAAGATLPACRMCHRDFNEANVALDTSGRVVVLDWDNCGPLPPDWEVGYVVADGGRGEWFMDKEAGWKELVVGYRAAGGVFEPRGLEAFSMAIAARHNFLAEVILASLRGDDWARATAGAILAYPLTVEYLRRALDAVG